MTLLHSLAVRRKLQRGKKVHCASQNPVARLIKLPLVPKTSAAALKLLRWHKHCLETANECYSAKRWRYGNAKAGRVSAGISRQLWCKGFSPRHSLPNLNVKIATLQKLIEALRNELQQYGEMLALLDQQQQLIRSCGADDIQRSIETISAQSGAIQAARQSREALQQEIARSVSQAEQSTFAELLPLLPPPYQPLVSALIRENNELLQRVRQSAQKNQAMLRQSLDYMQRFVSALAGTDQPIIAGEPHPLLPVQTGSPLYEAIA